MGNNYAWRTTAKSNPKLKYACTIDFANGTITFNEEEKVDHLAGQVLRLQQEETQRQVRLTVADCMEGKRFSYTQLVDMQATHKARARFFR